MAASRSLIRNRILLALPSDELARLLPQLEATTTTRRDVQHAAGHRIEAVHFPEQGWTSMVAQLEDGMVAEIGIVGRDGMVGLPLILGVACAANEAMVQMPGSALRMRADLFLEHLAHCPSLRAILLRYSHAFNIQVAQTAACNGRHGMDQRLVRWLLMAHDRTDGDELPLTQEFLAMMLCVHRPGVTVAARTLQAAGLIRYSKGHITVVDRARLEAACCECYAIVQRQYDALLGAAPTRWHAAASNKADQDSCG